MNISADIRCTAFEGSRRIESGELTDVALKAKKVLDRGEQGPVLIFDDNTSEQIEVDFRGSPEELLRRLEANSSRNETRELSDTTATNTSVARGPGRPRLGVVAREVTLLPRHWEWLSSQPGGASVALRKLVEEAKRVNKEKDRTRQAQEAAYRFMSAIAGNLAGFEEATRALFANKSARFDELVESWPVDVRDHARILAARVFQRPNPV